MKAIILNIIPILIFIMVFYFVLIRPSKIEVEEKDLLLLKLKINDKVQLTSGIIGKIKKIKEKTLIIESGNSEIELVKEYVEKIINE